MVSVLEQAVRAQHQAVDGVAFIAFICYDGMDEQKEKTA